MRHKIFPGPCLDSETLSEKIGVKGIQRARVRLNYLESGTAMIGRVCGILYREREENRSISAIRSQRQVG